MYRKLKQKAYICSQLFERNYFYLISGITGNVLAEVLNHTHAISSDLVKEWDYLIPFQMIWSAY